MFFIRFFPPMCQTHVHVSPVHMSSMSKGKGDNTDYTIQKYIPCPLNTKRVEVEPLLPFNNEDFVQQMVERVLTGKVRSLFAIYPTKIPLPLLLSILLCLLLLIELNSSKSFLDCNILDKCKVPYKSWW